jgi:predicted ABC-type ATPase
MTTLKAAIARVRSEQKVSKKPLAIIVAGHNGSGKSTMWTERLAGVFQIPLVNADRMMMSILPEIRVGGHLPSWASRLRDQDKEWMSVAQKGVEAFVAQAMHRQVPFAMETVFSHWKDLGKGKFESKIDLIHQMQEAGYFVLLLFVGLSNAQLSIGRVATRAALGGHTIDAKKLAARFPKTQRVIRMAASVADATIMTDNSQGQKQAFTVCRVQIAEEEIYDRRNGRAAVPIPIREWLDVVSPRI